MSDFKVVNRLEELRGLATLSSSDKQEIAEYYFSTLGKTFTNSSCNDCYRDACIEMILHIKRYGMKETTAYKLKNGVLLEPFFAGPMYTNANLTDEAAEIFLKHNPEGSNLFAEIPEDWEKRVVKRFTPKKERKESCCKRSG